MTRISDACVRHDYIGTPRLSSKRLARDGFRPPKADRVAQAVCT